MHTHWIRAESVDLGTKRDQRVHLFPTFTDFLDSEALTFKSHSYSSVDPTTSLLSGFHHPSPTLPRHRPPPLKTSTSHEIQAAAKKLAPTGPNTYPPHVFCPRAVPVSHLQCSPHSTPTAPVLPTPTSTGSPFSPSHLPTLAERGPEHTAASGLRVAWPFFPKTASSPRQGCISLSPHMESPTWLRITVGAEQTCNG